MFILSCKHCGKKWHGLNAIYTAIAKEFDYTNANDPDLKNEKWVWTHHKGCSHHEFVDFKHIKKIQQHGE